MANSPYVIETTAERFQADVTERSQTTPVVLDFWAAWCQPCRRLGPLLEKLADEYAGKFVLVKADTDQTPQQAMAFGVEGIPAVFAVRDGQIVESFVGLLTESQLREWLRLVVPSDGQLLVQAAQALEASDPALAHKTYLQALELDPQHAGAKLGLARVLVARGEFAAAREIVDQLAAGGDQDAELKRLQSQLQVREGAVDAAELAMLRAQADKSPNDSRVELNLANALAGAGDFDEALKHYLAVVRRERGPLRDEARAKMLDAFRALGDQSPLVSDYRRQLALALY